MRDLDQYRCLSTEGLLEAAREDGIDPDMAVALAERLEHITDGHYGSYPAMGGRYTFKDKNASRIAELEAALVAEKLRGVGAMQKRLKELEVLGDRVFEMRRQIAELEAQQKETEA